MIIKESQLRKIIREVLLESDETKVMDASIFKMLAPASRANPSDSEKSKPKIVSPKPANFDYTNLAARIVKILDEDDQVKNKEIDISDREFLNNLMKKVALVLIQREQNVKSMKKYSFS